MSEIFAYFKTDADWSGGYGHSMYDPELENPYAVENADEKISRAKEELDLDEYECREGEHWIRFRYQSILEGEPERVPAGDTE